jgi:biotin carboxylase
VSKKILILPATHFQFSVIEYAKSKGYYVVTSDNRPENPGHALADASYDVSTTNLDGILEVAKEENVDGVLAYASDPAAPAAAYAAEKLGLPGNPYESVKTLATKSLYRAFLRDHGFNYPDFVTLSSEDGLTQAEECVDQDLSYPVMVKPVDRSGSKGVTKVNDRSKLASALSEAADRSICGDAIVESFVSKSGPQIGGEAYVYDGELEMLCLGEQQVAKSVGNPHLPVGMIFPARLSDQIYSDIRQGLQRIINKLGYQFGAMNLEIMIDEEDQIHLMEIGPRSGGNMLPELMQHTEGVNVAKWSVEHSVGESISLSKTESSCKNVYAYYALHSVENGKLSKIVKENKIEKNIFREELFINRGQNVKAFSSSGDVVGILFASFDEYDECVRFFKNDQAYLEVVLK